MPSTNWSRDHYDRRFPTGADLLQNPSLNKGTAFSEQERDMFGLRGLLPPRIHTMEEQVMRTLENFRRKETSLEKYIHLISLQDRQETLFYRLLIDHLEEMMPIVYTPTVGQACQEYGHILRRPRGLFLSADDRGSFRKILRNWPTSRVRVVVVTDGERILGLGDLGADGMGISVGKLALYTACAGIDPEWCLPVTIDVGTDNEDLLNDPLYIGLTRRRVRGDEYDAIIDEFVNAVLDAFPGTLIQFEDFANRNAFRLLERYREQICTFNDDIQGTGAVALAGFLSAQRITGSELRNQTVLFLGAGEAGMGIAGMIVTAMMAQGLSEGEARRRCWFVDSKGLIVKGRGNLNEHKEAYAHDADFQPDMLTAVRAVKPTALIGVAGQSGGFCEEIIREMATVNERPVIFALSNPTSRAECTAEQAYAWSDGRAVFASGSPFDPVEIGGRTLVPGQGNNAYIFPGLGLAITACRASRVTGAMFHAAARTLAEQVTTDDLDRGMVYPPLRRIRDVSAHIAVAVARVVFDEGLAGIDEPDDLEAFVREQMYEPVYPDYA